MDSALPQLTDYSLLVGGFLGWLAFATFLALTSVSSLAGAFCAAFSESFKYDADNAREVFGILLTASAFSWLIFSMAITKTVSYALTIWGQ